MRKCKTLFLISGMAVVVGLTGLTGCASSSSSHGDDRTAGRVVDDNKVTAQVKTGLNTEPVYKFNEVDVRTFAGVVQLSGFVNSEDQKRRTGEIAQQTPGVAQVVNNITLKPQAGPPPTGREYTNGVQKIDAPYYNPNTNTAAPVR